MMTVEEIKELGQKIDNVQNLTGINFAENGPYLYGSCSLPQRSWHWQRRSEWRVGPNIYGRGQVVYWRSADCDARYSGNRSKYGRLAKEARLRCASMNFKHWMRSTEHHGF